MFPDRITILRPAEHKHSRLRSAAKIGVWILLAYLAVKTIMFLLISSHP